MDVRFGRRRAARRRNRECNQSLSDGEVVSSERRHVLPELLQNAVQHFKEDTASIHALSDQKTTGTRLFPSFLGKICSRISFSYFTLSFFFSIHVFACQITNAFHHRKRTSTLTPKVAQPVKRVFSLKIIPIIFSCWYFSNQVKRSNSNKKR